MVRVGVHASVPQSAVELIPPDVLERVELVRLLDELSEPVEIEFWVMPFGPKPAAAAAPWLRGVKVMQSVMAGVDWIGAWRPEGAVLCDGRGVLDVSTAEWVVAVMLAMVKRLPEHRDAQRAHEWRGQPSMGSTGTLGSRHYSVLSEDLAGRRVLIVGYGSIGAAIERRLQGFEVEVMRVARTAREGVHAVSSLRELLPQADVVVLQVALTEETRGLIGREEIARMKPGALLINAARGKVVDTDALVEALQAGRIKAALDVVEPEPLPDEHPLWTAPNVLITPHVAGSTPELMARGFKLVGEQLRRYLEGAPLENVVGEEGY
jgi:phosphoglycerate dehydrogenase-like enzyme